MTFKRKIVVAALAVLAVVGGGGAFAATRLASPEESSREVLNDAAKTLGVKPSELTDALKGALKKQVDEAVAAGRLTEEQGAALKERIDAGRMPLVGFPGPFFEDHEVHFPGLAAAASYLGIGEAGLRSQLEDGKTLAEVAKARGKTVSGLVDALVADAKERLDDAVAAGRLSKAEADRVLADLEAMITRFVNGEGPRSFRHGRPGDGPHWFRPGRPGDRDGVVEPELGAPMF